MSQEASNELREFLDPGEEIRWHGRPGGSPPLPRLLLWGFALGWFFVLFVMRMLRVETILIENFAVVPDTTVAVTDRYGGSTVQIPTVTYYFVGFTFVFFLVALILTKITLSRLNPKREYAVTDRGVIKSDLRGKEFKSLRWEDVESIEFPNRENGMIYIRPRSESRLASLLPFSVKLSTDEPHEAYESMIRAFEEATGDDKENTTTFEDDRDSVSEEVRSMLESDERVLWQSTGSRGLGDIGLVTLGYLLFLLSAFGFGAGGVYILLNLDSMGSSMSGTVILVGGALFCVFLALYVPIWLFRSWESESPFKSQDYVITDRQLIKCEETESELRCESVRWEDVETVQRRLNLLNKDSIQFYTEDFSEVESTSQADSPSSYSPTLSFDFVPDAKRVYWKIREIQRTRATEARAEA